VGCPHGVNLADNGCRGGNEAEAANFAAVLVGKDFVNRAGVFGNRVAVVQAGFAAFAGRLAGKQFGVFACGKVIAVTAPLGCRHNFPLPRALRSGSHYRKTSRLHQQSLQPRKT
jgi:hypothetical protein